MAKLGRPLRVTEDEFVSVVAPMLLRGASVRDCAKATGLSLSTTKEMLKRTGAFRVKYWVFITEGGAE
jgi:transposase-like protein